MRPVLQVSPSDRQAFLDKLTPADRAQAVETETRADQGSLLNTIDEFVEALEGKMTDAEYDDYREYDDYYDDEDDLGPYQEAVDELEMLFEQINALFDERLNATALDVEGETTEQVELAKHAYRRLFDVFQLEDDYGRGISPDHLSGTDMTEVVARYLRAVYETAPPEGRPKSLFDEMLRARNLMMQNRVALSNLIEITTKPLPDKARFLDDWIAFLHGQREKAADYWLREAVRLAGGIKGLQELAIEAGKTHPRAFLDWIAALTAEERYRDVMQAVETAQRVLVADLPIRAAIADYLYEAARQLGDSGRAAAARWEAFYAKPQLFRLLDLWESTPEPSARVELMQRAAKRIQAHLARKLPFSPHVDSLGGDDAEIHAPQTRSTLAHAYLLAMDFQSVHQIACEKANVLGWTDANNPQGLVVISFLGLACGKTPDGFPPNLSLLWDTALKNSVGFYENEALLSRLKAAHGEMFNHGSLGSEAETLLSWCLGTAKKRAASIVLNQYRRSYWKAATLITAGAEVLRLAGREREAQELISEMANQFPRHRAFQAELRQARGRRGSLSPVLADS